MNGSFAKLYMNSLYRKKEFNQSKFHDKLNKRKKRSNSISTDRKNSPENKNKYLLNTLYKKRDFHFEDKGRIIEITSVKK